MSKTWKMDFTRKAGSSISRVIVAGFLVLGLGIGLVGCSKSDTASSGPPKFSELTDADKAQLDKERGVIVAVLKKRGVTNELTRTKADLPVLQQLIYDRVFTSSQLEEWRCLGVVFGDVMVSEMPLRWMMVKKPQGDESILRFKETPVQVNPRVLIAKRVEDGEPVDLNSVLQLTGMQFDVFEKQNKK